jgi:hypothetical protein
MPRSVISRLTSAANRHTRQEAQTAVRYRENTPEELARAPRRGRGLAHRNPAGTGEKLLAAIGHQFHRDFGVVLRAVLLFAVDYEANQERWHKAWCA